MRRLHLAGIFVGLSVLAFATACGDDSTPGTTSTCSPACAGGAMCCPRTGMRPMCISVQSDPMNCGGCGIACGAGERCTAGSCMATAVDSGPRDSSVTPITDGGGTTDSGGGGSCMPTCASDQQCCGGRCANRQTPAGTMDGRTDSSFMNCGRCGNACMATRANRCGTLPGRTEVTCLCGTTAACTTGMCTLEGGSFRCTDTTTDPLHCGTPPVACAAGETCTGGMCVCGSTGRHCATGEACCGGMCVNTTSDPHNCGRCMNPCPSRNPDCNGGTCHCGTGTATCMEATDSLGTVCCGVGASASCVPETDMNCRMCGNDCTTMMESCIVSVFGGSSCCGDPNDSFAFCPSEGDGGSDGSI